MTTVLEKSPTRRSRNLSTFWNSPLERFFRNDFLPDLWNGDNKLTVPAINVTEEKNDYLVEMAAPGLKKEDFDIRLEGNLLTISSEKEDKEEKESDNYARREYNYSYFSRTVTLPDSAENKNIVAKYTDGILHLTIPKKPDAIKNGSQKIKVQ